MSLDVASSLVPDPTVPSESRMNADRDVSQEIAGTPRTELSMRDAGTSRMWRVVLAIFAAGCGSGRERMYRLFGSILGHELSSVVLSLR